MARGSKGKAAADLRAFRSKVAALKAKGVIRAKVDARSVRPTRYRKAQVKSLQDVLTGHIAAVKAKPSIVKEFKNAGAKVVNGRILVRKEPQQIASVKRGEFTEGVVTIRQRLDKGFVEEQIILPLGKERVGDILEDMKTDPAKYNRLKNPEDRFGFRLNGSGSSITFGSISEMADWVSNYEDSDSIDDVDVEDYPDFFTVFRTTKSGWLGTYNRQKKARKDSREARFKWPRENVRAANAFYEKKRRDRGGDAFREKEAARKRAARAHMSDADRAAEAARKKASRKK